MFLTSCSLLGRPYYVLRRYPHQLMKLSNVQMSPCIISWSASNFLIILKRFDQHNEVILFTDYSDIFCCFCEAGTAKPKTGGATVQLHPCSYVAPPLGLLYLCFDKDCVGLVLAKFLQKFAQLDVFRIYSRFLEYRL